MKIPEELSKLSLPGEKVIVFDPESGDVHHSDFAPFKKTQDGTLNLTQVVDANNEKDVFQVISMAMRLPGTMTESECVFRGAKSRMRVVYFPTPAPRIFLFIVTR